MNKKKGVHNCPKYVQVKCLFTCPLMAWQMAFLGKKILMFIT